MRQLGHTTNPINFWAMQESGCLIDSMQSSQFNHPSLNCVNMELCLFHEHIEWIIYTLLTAACERCSRVA